MRNRMRVTGLPFVLAIALVFLPACYAQQSPTTPTAKSVSGSLVTCQKSLASQPIEDALLPVCLRTHAAGGKVAAHNAIIVGFVGGYAQHDDRNHPEVHFAALLHESDPSLIDAEVFRNRDGDKALRRVLQLIDTDQDGVIDPGERKQARVIIYGHSWGGSQTVTLARELAQHGIPVLLTIQLDSIRKPRQEDEIIPPNVKTAINFYQTRGFLHGQPVIRAADPDATKILGNVQMTYGNHPINCDNYHWFVRHFNKPHHEIENDPRVWNQVASLIDAALAN